MEQIVFTDECGKKQEIIEHIHRLKPAGIGYG